MLIVWFLSRKSLPNLLFGVLCLPGDQSHPVCETDNKPSRVLHLLGWFIGSRGFSSLERRPEFWVLHYHCCVGALSCAVSPPTMDPDSPQVVGYQALPQTNSMVTH